MDCVVELLTQFVDGSYGEATAQCDAQTYQGYDHGPGFCESTITLSPFSAPFFQLPCLNTKSPPTHL